MSVTAGQMPTQLRRQGCRSRGHHACARQRAPSVILCKLVEWGEASVNSLAAAIGLSQSALSQHLAKMRDEGLVSYRRESQTLWYRIADPRIEELFAMLHLLFCRPRKVRHNRFRERNHAMSLPKISPQRAKQMLDDGAILIDIREPDEHAREHIAAANHMPLSRLDDADLSVHQGRPVVFHCRSGARTLGNAPRLAAKLGGDCQAYIVDGGLDAWRKAGLPVVTDRRQPMELQRQVQIGAGSLAFFGTLLGLLAIAVVLSRTDFCRRRPDDRRHHRILRHGPRFGCTCRGTARLISRRSSASKRIFFAESRSRHDPVADSGRARRRLRLARRILARPGRRWWLDPRRTASHLRRRCYRSARRDRHQRHRGRRQRVRQSRGTTAAPAT